MCAGGATWRRALRERTPPRKTRARRVRYFSSKSRLFVSRSRASALQLQFSLFRVGALSTRELRFLRMYRLESAHTRGKKSSRGTALSLRSGHLYPLQMTCRLLRSPPMFFMWRPPDAIRGGSRRSTDRMLTSGGTNARGRFTESSAKWGGRGRPLTPVEAISASSYLAYGGAGRGPPYTKYEGPNHALSGVSGRA